MLLTFLQCYLLIVYISAMLLINCIHFCNVIIINYASAIFTVIMYLLKYLVAIYYLNFLFL